METEGQCISSILLYLVKLEKQGTTLGKIDDQRLFVCDMSAVPINWVPLNIEEHKSYSEDSGCIYFIPNNGDILHSIKIKGRFKKAEIFQYSFLDNRIVYESITGMDKSITEDTITVLNPFPSSGIPFLQLIKNMYLEYIPEKDGDPIKVKFGEGYLDNPLRKQFSDRRKFREMGVSIMHRTGMKYAVFGMHAQGHSINVLGPLA